MYFTLRASDKARLARRRAAYAKGQRAKQRAINITIAVVFVLANVALAAYFWPKLVEHKQLIEEGKRKPFIEIRLNN